VQTVLDAYEAVQKQNGARDRRWRVEHTPLVVYNAGESALAVGDFNGATSSWTWP